MRIKNDTDKFIWEQYKKNLATDAALRGMKVSMEMMSETIEMLRAEIKALKEGRSE